MAGTEAMVGTVAARTDRAMEEMLATGAAVAHPVAPEMVETVATEAMAATPMDRVMEATPATAETVARPMAQVTVAMAAMEETVAAAGFDQVASCRLGVWSPHRYSSH
ncbi:hypothetical protein FRB95_011442 [Tulasnella sp. JGI-2019a]|nr:hypothetical protein FRB95_011442 [Tulasnella sp. JGI-2019a]